MKKQAESILWEIAKGDAIPQGEKTIYPSVRERISALTTLGKWEGWDKPAQKAAEIIAQDLQRTQETLQEGDNPFEEILDEEGEADVAQGIVRTIPRTWILSSPLRNRLLPVFL